MTAAQALAPGWVAWLIYGVLALPVVWALRPRRYNTPAPPPESPRPPRAARDEHPRLHGPAVKQVRR